MRILLAVVMFAGGAFALNSTADAGRKNRRSVKPPYHVVEPRYRSREQALCEERAQQEDPTGRFAGYPCWAREMFGRGSSSGRGR